MNRTIICPHCGIEGAVFSIVKNYNFCLNTKCAKDISHLIIVTEEEKIEMGKYFLKSDETIDDPLIICPDCQRYANAFEIKENNKYCINNDCSIDLSHLTKLVDEKRFAELETYNKTNGIDILCPKCRKKQNLRAVFCRYCGTEISPKELITTTFCEECNTEYHKSNKFCEKCGHQLIEKKVEKNTKNKYQLKKTIDAQIQNDNEQLGFGWGNFWIVGGFLQGSMAFFISVIMNIQTSQIPNRGVGLLISIVAIGSAYGLMKRKIFGLYLIYINFFALFVYGLIDLVSGEGIISVRGTISIVMSIVWFIYFNKRKEMFS